MVILKQRSLQMSAHLFGKNISVMLFFIVQEKFLMKLTIKSVPLLPCSSTNETLSTLKFAQRAKLIQNNVFIYF